MPADLWEVEVGNTDGYDTNTAISTYHLDSTSGVADDVIAAQLIANTAWGEKADGCYIASVRVRKAGSAGSSPVAWPTTAYSALRVSYPGLPELGSYGATFGTGGLNPAGTSGTLSLYSAIPGRSTTGRLYTSFPRQAAVSPDGTTTIAFREEIVDAYKTWVMGDPSGDFDDALAVDLMPLVYSPTNDTDTPVVTPLASTKFARLKSRTR